MAEYRSIHVFTATPTAVGEYVAASAQVRSSPVTSATGTPYSAASIAFIRPSEAVSPLIRTEVIEFGR